MSAYVHSDEYFTLKAELDAVRAERDAERALADDLYAALNDVAPRVQSDLINPALARYRQARGQ